ncbi:MAG TPA: hypothetical protein VGI39_32075 [Polyangiaceae bacterium]|jgi:hypothetical protein
MPDDPKPNPFQDLRQGLGLLFRAAKTTLEKLPTGELEEAVKTGAKEVTRALENVTHAVEEQILRKPSVRTGSAPPPAPGHTAASADEHAHEPHEPPSASDEPPK